MCHNTPSAGIYMRLSKDDKDRSESSSITNQRKLLLAYAKARKLPVTEEYVDDGYSGTNFNRPAFRRMLADIENRRINVILTKDLSRLGRDYIMTGQYTEVYFPSRHVRFIAVNDGFDSASSDTDIGPFKNVVNEMYARDTSRKIRSAFLVRMQEGSYVGSLAPFGYRKSSEDRHRLIPDPPAAAIVRRIFEAAGEGSSPSQIAAALSRLALPTPSAYRTGKERSGSWSARTVIKILRNPVYLGHMVQGKSRKVSFKSSLTIANPPESWIVVEHTHEPLIDKALFERAGELLDSRRCRSLPDGGRPSPCVWGSDATPSESPAAGLSIPHGNGSSPF